ncbi:MAG: hypothetical protein EP344_19775 [Bacteroidetes bacterium]|nr:MAG: hypothetical protein EP344_19775 [Bacteroidota bacterium]
MTHPLSPTTNPTATMPIDIAAHIEKLLFLHDTLTIPGFGGFTATRVPAAVDYAGGAVTPPSKTLSFSENLSVDDGILVDELVKIHGISLEEARNEIEHFVEKVQAQLNQREIVTLPGVGRLYKNYVQKIQFLPDATNFHAGSYGLPPLQFSPIARSREVAADKTTTTAPAETTTGQQVATDSEGQKPEPAKKTMPAVPPLPPPPNFVSEPYSAPRSSAARFGTGIGIGLIICTISFGIWWWLNKSDPNPEQLAGNQPVTTELQSPATTPVPGVSEIARLAEKDQQQTSSDPAAAPEQEDIDLNDEVEEAAARKVEVLQRQNEAPPATTTSPQAPARQCILIIATLQDRNNADRLIAKLKGAGFDVYYRQQRGHQVGVQFMYSDPQEIEQKRSELVTLTGEKNIFLKQK